MFHFNSDLQTLPELLSSMVSGRALCDWQRMALPPYQESAGSLRQTPLVDTGRLKFLFKEMVWKNRHAPSITRLHELLRWVKTPHVNLAPLPLLPSAWGCSHNILAQHIFSKPIARRLKIWKPAVVEAEYAHLREAEEPVRAAWQRTAKLHFRMKDERSRRIVSMSLERGIGKTVLKVLY